MTKEILSGRVLGGFRRVFASLNRRNMMETNVIIFSGRSGCDKRTLASDWISRLEDNGYKVYSSP